MRRWIVLPLILMALSGVAAAADTALTPLDTTEAGRQWEGVGRLDIGGSGFCTGALIAPDLVLTAAHCLFESQTGARIDHKRIEFLAGWRNGRASAVRQVRRALVHPGYRFEREANADQVSNDVALLELQMPIRNGVIRPFATGGGLRRGDRVHVVSYGRSRAEAPSLQNACHVLARQSGVLVTSCSADFGSSGAPIFALDGGEARIVSVISAKAHADGRDVSLGMSLDAPLRDLMAELDAGGGFGLAPSPRESRIRVGSVRNDIGAKFVRP